MRLIPMAASADHDKRLIEFDRLAVLDQDRADHEGGVEVQRAKAGDRQAQRFPGPDRRCQGGNTVAGLAEDRFLILPHEEVAGFEQARAGDRERWLAAMRRLQARIDGA